MTSIQVFIDVVQKSRVLSASQKKELLEHPQSLPKSYRERAMVMLVEFDEHSAYREATLHSNLDASLDTFAQKLEEAGIDEVVTVQLLAKAKRQARNFFSNTQAGV